MSRSKKNPNFSKMELQVLSMRSNPTKKAFSKNCTSVTKHPKKRVWAGISEKVNAVSSGQLRTVDELREKHMKAIRKRKFP